MTQRLECEAPDLASVQRMLSPGPELERRIRALIDEQLGGVLPRDPRRGQGRYYDTVVLGGRSLDAYRVLKGHVGRSGLRVLDIGSGLGTFVLMASRLGMPAFGVEPGERELGLARERGAAMGLDGEDLFRPGVGEDLPVEDAEASNVLLHDVLEHVGDWRAVLAEASRVLAPGGVLYVKGPSYSVRFFEPHYRVPWLPLLPRTIARPYLSALGRDVGYFEHLGYRRRGAVVKELRALGLELSFPRTDKLQNPSSINRQWARRLVSLMARGGDGVARPLQLLAENPLQAAIDVVARKPGNWPAHGV